MTASRKTNALQEQGGGQIKNDHAANHISKNILAEHFCYCRPGVPCVLCLAWNRLIRRMESREMAL